jgi:hypothetical protein
MIYPVGFTHEQPSCATDADSMTIPKEYGLWKT